MSQKNGGNGPMLEIIMPVLIEAMIVIAGLLAIVVYITAIAS